MASDTTSDVGPWTDFQQAAPAQTGAPWEDFQSNAPAKQPFTLMDTWPVRLVQSLWNAAKLPGDVYQGNAAVPQSANMPGGENTSAIARTTALAGIAPVSQIGAAFRMAAPTDSMLKASASSKYNTATALPIEVKPQAVGGFNFALQSAMNGEGFNDVTAPLTFKLLDKLQPPQGAAAVTPQNLRAIQRSLGMIRDNTKDATDSLAAGNALDHFNNFLENIMPGDLSKGTPDQAAQFSQLVKSANGDYRAYKQSNAFDFRGDVASNNAHASNSGMNLENALRTQVRQILNNPRLQRGYDADTLQAMRDFNNGSTAANVTRMLGNLMGGGGGWGMLASAGIGHLMGLPPEALPMLGMGFKQIGNQRALSQFGKIGEMIRANSPLAQSGVTSRIPRITIPLTMGQRLLPQVLNPSPIPDQINNPPYLGAQ